MLAVVRREFLARVRTKTFVVATVLGPLLMGALMIGPALLANQGTSGRYIVVLAVGV